jgi:site-specific recombinase XerD
MKLSATVKEAVTDAEIDISQEEDAEARPRPARPRTRQDSGVEQPNFRERPADLRPRHSRVRHLVLLGAAARVQSHRRAPLSDHLEQRGYAPATINLRLAAVRRIAYEAADAGVLSPELAAGIRRVKGVRRIGVRLGNWLTREQGLRLLEHPTLSTARALRDYAMVSTPKSGRLRYVPMTARLAAALRDHRHLRGTRVVCQRDGSPLTQDVVRDHVQRAARRAQLAMSGVHRLRHTFCSHLAMRGAPARAIQELAGHQDLTTTQRYMHLSPAAIESAIRLLEQPSPSRNFGDILETGDREMANSQSI